VENSVPPATKEESAVKGRPLQGRARKTGTSEGGGFLDTGGRHLLFVGGGAALRR